MPNVDKPHVTHFDDCGCKSAKYEEEIARLKRERERLNAWLTYYTQGDMKLVKGWPEDDPDLNPQDEVKP